MDFEQAISTSRVSLAHLPTPLEAVRGEWHSHRLFIKRDDLTGSVLSGNKVRKLEYLLADACRPKCDVVITCGGIQSNHARATAVAARQLGLDSLLVLTGEKPDVTDGNLLLGEMVGAEIRVFPKMSGEARLAKAHAIADELREAGRKPYVIPSGGSNEIGVLGYMRAAKELVSDCAIHCTEASAVLVAVGSGGTYAGLFLGLKMLGSNLRLIGATVDEDPSYWHPALTDYIKRSIKQWGLPVEFDPSEIELIPAAGRGYAISDPAEIEYIAGFARQTGVFLDPVYTGKTMYAADKAMADGGLELSGDVVFIHTGGVFGLFPSRELFDDVIRTSPR